MEHMLTVMAILSAALKLVQLCQQAQLLNVSMELIASASTEVERVRIMAE